MYRVHETILFSRAFALPGGQECLPQAWCRQGASTGGGPGLVLAGSTGTGPLPLGTGDASDRDLTQNSFPSPSPYCSSTTTCSFLFVLCFYLPAFSLLLISLLHFPSQLLLTVISCFFLPLVSFPVLLLPSLFSALTCHTACP